MHLACFLGWSHCCSKPEPEGAMQMRLKGCPAFTVASLALTSTSKSSSTPGAKEEEHISAPQSRRFQESDNSIAMTSFITEWWLTRSSLLTHTQSENRQISHPPTPTPPKYDIISSFSGLISPCSLLIVKGVSSRYCSYSFSCHNSLPPNDLFIR